MRKKTVFIMIIPFLLINCSKNKNEDLPKVEISKEKSLENRGIMYRCNNQLDFDFGGKAEINFANDSILKIKNYSNSGYETHQIEILINKKLEIVKMDYSYSDDVEDGTKSYYDIEKANVYLNKDPYKDGLENIRGGFLLDVKVVDKPSEFYKRSKTYHKKIEGTFECSSN